MDNSFCTPCSAQSQLQALTAQQQEIQLKQQLEVLASSPFGDSPLFRSAISVRVDVNSAISVYIVLYYGQTTMTAEVVY